jgi:CheY-like chemotaxis protein
MNLAINARDAMPMGGVLALASSMLSHDGKHCAALRVSDSGGGIDAAHLPHIFDPFFTTKDVGQGTGLGLATVHGIVTQSQGQIWAENEPEGGARFTVILPLTEEPPAEIGPTATTESLRRGRILLVEDEDTVRSVISRTLEAGGYTVVPAGNGAEALTRLSEAADGVDVILSDIVMPVMGGAELVRQVKSRWPAMPVIWMSGYPKDGPHTMGVLHDDQPFLQKPVPPDLLLRTVNEVIGRQVKAG